MRTAIIHYWLVNMRGGEKVIEALLEIFPFADIFTHVYNPKAVSPVINARRVFTSSINKLPFAKKIYRLYLPLMPKALVDFDLREYDLVISSEAGPAKGVVPNPGAFHLCYCHSPMRYIWDLYHEYNASVNFFVRFFMRCFTPRLRIWDITSANMVDRFITNSEFTAKRIRRVYNRDAEVVFGPADTQRFLDKKREPSDFYLFFGQITSYKRVDIAIEACAKTGRKLIVAGAGMEKRLKKKYAKNKFIKFLGKVSDEEMLELFSRAKALLYPGIEDMGLVPIEANAAGCPVIAYRGGGAVETVMENVTGLFFDERTGESLAAAMDLFERNAYNFTDRQLFNDHVQQFSKAAFIARIQKIVAEKQRL